MSATRKGKFAKMDISKLSHNALISYLANNLDDRDGWEEFHRRFNRFITSVIIRTCRKIPYHRGLNELNDLVHNVYVKLLERNGKALKGYKGQYENTIFEWLRVISIRIVLYDFNSNTSRSRTPEGGLFSIDEPYSGLDRNRLRGWQEIIPEGTFDETTNYAELREEIEYCLEKSTAGSRSPERDRLIFHLYIFDGMDVPSITAFAGIDLTEKRVSNLISELKEKVRQCLQSRGIRPSFREKSG